MEKNATNMNYIENASPVSLGGSPVLGSWGSPFPLLLFMKKEIKNRISILHFLLYPMVSFLNLDPLRTNFSIFFIGWLQLTLYHFQKMQLKKDNIVWLPGQVDDHRATFLLQAYEHKEEYVARPKSQLTRRISKLWCIWWASQSTKQDPGINVTRTRGGRLVKQKKIIRISTRFSLPKNIKEKSRN